MKQGIRRLEKLMNAISSLLSALQDTLTEIPNIQRVVLVLGASLLRPQHVYEIFFTHGRFVSASANDCSKSKAAEALSRKVLPLPPHYFYYLHRIYQITYSIGYLSQAIRALISNGAGASSYAGYLLSLSCCRKLFLSYMNAPCKLDYSILSFTACWSFSIAKGYGLLGGVERTQQLWCDT